MTATFKITDFNRYEKVIVQFLARGKGVFNTTGYNIEFLPDNIITMYYNSASALASYSLSCQHDITDKVISTDYFRFTQILKALASEGTDEVSFTLEENETGAIIKIDTGSTHIDLPAFIITEEFTKNLPYSEDTVVCTFEDLELYEATKLAASFLVSSEAGASVFLNTSAISNDSRYVYVAKKKWGFDLSKEVSISKQNLSIFNVFKALDENAVFKYIELAPDKKIVHMLSEKGEFNLQIGEPVPITAAPSDTELEAISTSTVLTELTAGELLSIINFFLSTGIFDGQKWFPLTVQSFPDTNKIKFTVRNTQFSAIPALNVERWIDVPGLAVSVEDTISADILEIFLSRLEKTTSIRLYTDPESNGIRFETVDQDLYLAKFS